MSSDEPWRVVDHAFTASGDDIELRRRAGGFEIRCNGWELMSSRAHHSEDIAAKYACAALSDRTHPRALIGGLGMGYTLRAALDALPATAHVVVAEILADVVAWNRGVLSPLAGAPLADSRVSVACDDVAAVIAAAADSGLASARFDAIILDIDNGPSAIMLDCNVALYTERGVATLRRALNQGGMLSVWSADPAPEFAARLDEAGFLVERHNVRAQDHCEAPLHTIYLGRA